MKIWKTARIFLQPITYVMCHAKFTHFMVSSFAVTVLELTNDWNNSQSFIRRVLIKPELQLGWKCEFMTERLRQSSYYIGIAGSNSNWDVLTRNSCWDIFTAKLLREKMLWERVWSLNQRRFPYTVLTFMFTDVVFGGYWGWVGSLN